MIVHEEFRPRSRVEMLPEGVRAYGHRYEAVIKTPTRTVVLGEFETVDEARHAYREALHSHWNG